MNSSVPPSGAVKARLLRRAGAVARLRHPNLVRMLSLPGGAGLSPILGEARRLADFTLPAGTFKRFDLVQVVRLLIDVLSGLAALHEVETDGEAFVHGEVSPQHVYIDEHGTARLVPLLSSHFTGSARAEHPGYLAPERIAGEHIDVRADVFSVGVMLWEALAGTRLFKETSLSAVLARLAGPLDPHLGARERWAEPLCEIALRAISAEPALRFQTALELSNAMATAAAPQLSRVDESADAWQEEAPTPVFQPHLHLAPVRIVTPPPLPESARSASPTPAAYTTAPPTTTSEAPALPPPPSASGLLATRGRRSAFVVTLTALAAAAGWLGAPPLQREWRKLTTSPFAAEPLSIRAAASEPVVALPAKPPIDLDAPTPTPSTAAVPSTSSVATASAAPAAASKAPSRPSAASAKPKLKVAHDYGI